MQYTVVGKSFWLGIMNAVLFSIPMWGLIYLALKVFFRPCVATSKTHIINQKPEYPISARFLYLIKRPQKKMERKTCSIFSSSSITSKYNLNRAEKDFRIQGKRLFLNVVQIQV